MNYALFMNKGLSVEMINIKKKSWNNLMDHNQIQRISQASLKELKFKKRHYTLQCRNLNQCEKLHGQSCEQCERKLTKEKEK